MKLKYDPYGIFYRNSSPFGLYARKKWLQEDKKSAFKLDFNRTVSKIYAAQKEDGSWNYSAVDTARELFSLHLTVREKTAQIQKALEWLMNLRTAGARKKSVNGEKNSDALFPPLRHTLPFLPSGKRCFLNAAILFLATVFQLDEKSEYRKIYAEWQSEIIHSGKTLTPAERNNILRAYVVNPNQENQPLIDKIIGSLKKQQTKRGDWGEEYDFFQLFNALAHSSSVDADLQVRKALPLVFASQKTDGTWGARPLQNPVFATFLTIHALKNKGLLKI